MGRQAYLTRLALGRSPYEPLPQSNSHDSDDELQGQDEAIPENSWETSTTFNTEIPSSYQQQYDSSGYPENLESKALSGQYRRAHNDVLEMVRTYVGVHAEGQPIKSQLDSQRKSMLDKSAVEAVVRENEIGLLVGSADISLLYLCNMCTIGLKHRLQAYRFYSGIPLTQILKAEWKHFGVAKFLFAGAPAGLTYIFLDMFSLWAIEEFIQIIAHRLLQWSDPRIHKILKRLLYNFCYLLQFVSFTFLAPLEMFSTLQRLDLVSAWPLFPRFRSFIPLSLSSPIHMPALQDPFSLRSYLNIFASLAVSPLFLWGLIYWARPSVSQKLYAYMRAALPKPTVPDTYSLQAAKETDLDEDSVPGLYPESSGLFPSNSVLEELARDLQYIGKTFIQVYDRWMWKKPQNPDRIQQSEIRSATRPVLPDLDVFNTNLPSIEGAADASPSSSSIGSPHPTSSFSYPPTRPTTPGPSVEIVSSFAPASDDTRIIKVHDRQPQHRITALTAYAADSMASHLASHLTDLLFLPLEALFVRSVAIAFLSSPAAGSEAQTAAMRWKREIFPIRGWFGTGLRGGGWRGVADYAGKMVLVSGMEVGISMAIWQACTGFSWWCGRTYFGWGKL